VVPEEKGNSGQRGIGEERRASATFPGGKKKALKGKKRDRLTKKKKNSSPRKKRGERGPEKKQRCTISAKKKYKHNEEGGGRALSLSWRGGQNQKKKKGKSCLMERRARTTPSAWKSQRSLRDGRGTKKRALDFGEGSQYRRQSSPHRSPMEGEE